MVAQKRSSLEKMIPWAMLMLLCLCCVVGADRSTQVHLLTGMEIGVGDELLIVNARFYNATFAAPDNGLVSQRLVDFGFSLSTPTAGVETVVCRSSRVEAANSTETGGSSCSTGMVRHALPAQFDPWSCLSAFLQKRLSTFERLSVLLCCETPLCLVGRATLRLGSGGKVGGVSLVPQTDLRAAVTGKSFVAKGVPLAQGGSVDVRVVLHWQSNGFLYAFVGNSSARPLLTTARDYDEGSGWTFPLLVDPLTAKVRLGVRELHNADVESSLIFDDEPETITDCNTVISSVAASILGSPGGPRVCAQMFLVNPASVVILPLTKDRSSPLILNHAADATPAAVGHAYCGTYASTPDLELRIAATFSDAPSFFNASVVVSAEGYSRTCNGVLFRLDSAREAANIVLVSSTSSFLPAGVTPAAAEGGRKCFGDAIGTVGRSPWIELQYVPAQDAFWVTLSLGGFYLTRC